MKIIKILLKLLIGEFDRVKLNLDPYNWEVIMVGKRKLNNYKDPFILLKFEIKRLILKRILNHCLISQIPKVALPKYEAWGEILRWTLQENVPGEFPFTAGLYPFKRTGEDPTRMFAGEGGPERTNRRFHYVSHGNASKTIIYCF